MDEVLIFQPAGLLFWCEEHDATLLRRKITKD